MTYLDQEKDDSGSLVEKSGRRGHYRYSLPLAILLLALTSGFVNAQPAGQQAPWVYQRAEFNLVDMLESRHVIEDHLSAFSPVLFMDKLYATEYLCVAESSAYYPYLTIHQELTGITIDSSCPPLDFTDRPADNLHPALITQPVVSKYLYYAYVTGFEPTSDTAVLVEAHGDRFVLVNVSTLEYLGVTSEVFP